MNFFAHLKKFFTVDDSVLEESFTLMPPDPPPGGQGKPARKGLLRGRSRQSPGLADQPQQAVTKPDLKDPIPDDLSVVEEQLKQIFHKPDNADFVLRPFEIPLQPPVKAIAAFLDGMVNSMLIDMAVLQPLMRLTELGGETGSDTGQGPLQLMKHRLLPGNQVKEATTWEKVLQAILSGDTAVFVDGVGKALMVETKGYDKRSIEQPQAEMVVRGPHEAFTETLRSNTALLRRRLQTAQLVTEMVKVGKLSGSDCAIMYLKGIANPELVGEVKRRIKVIKTDFVGDSGMIEQFIEDSPYGLYPSTLATERPDRVAAALSEGHVAILLNNSPTALVVPATFWLLFHTAEDAYIRWPFGMLLRLLRLISVFLSLLLPAIYIAGVNYHQELIPTELLVSIAAARERVPFPLILEVLLMEFSFELIREAGIRIPSVIGPTIGIVGALILGQAAVQAGIVSPILVIIVALTGLASFTMPNYALSLNFRLMRFGYILLASVLGLFGVSIGLGIQALHLCGFKSFGVPFLSPLSPHRPSTGDLVVRTPTWLQERRPPHLVTQDIDRQDETTRPWDPFHRKPGDET